MLLKALVRTPWALLVARVFLSVLFIVAGWNKLSAYDQTVSYIGGLVGNPGIAPLLTVLAIVFELGGGLMLLLNWKTELALNMLVVFTIIATILGHNDFSDTAKAQMNFTQILKNLGLIGGLIALSTVLLDRKRAPASAHSEG